MKGVILFILFFIFLSIHSSFSQNFALPRVITIKAGGDQDKYFVPIVLYDDKNVRDKFGSKLDGTGGGLIFI